MDGFISKSFFKKSELYKTSEQDLQRFADYLKSPNNRQRLMAQRFMNDKTLLSTQKYLKIAADAGLHPVTLATAWSKQFDFVAFISASN